MRAKSHSLLIINEIRNREYCKSVKYLYSRCKTSLQSGISDHGRNKKTSKIFRSWRLAEAEMNLLLVPEAGLEPAWHAPYAPETYASTNFATRALGAKTCEGKSTHRLAFQLCKFLICGCKDSNKYLRFQISSGLFLKFLQFFISLHQNIRKWINFPV